MPDQIDLGHGIIAEVNGDEIVLAAEREEVTLTRDQFEHLAAFVAARGSKP
jgi:hypothetical protein